MNDPPRTSTPLDERERAIRATLLGILLGAALAMLGHGRRPQGPG
jgi:hypothetical protein